MTIGDFLSVLLVFTLPFAGLAGLLWLMWEFWYVIAIGWGVVMVGGFAVCLHNPKKVEDAQEES